MASTMATPLKRSQLVFTLLIPLACFLLLQPLTDTVSKISRGWSYIQGTFQAPLQSTHSAAHAYSSFIISQDPLVTHISNFVNAEEAAHVVNISEPYFANSGVYRDNTSTAAHTILPSVRTSLSAVPPRSPTLLAIEQRALDFQGFTVDGPLERIKVVRYHPGGHFTYHYDWFSPAAGASRGWNRYSSFFVYLETNCTGGGTNFPELRRPIWKEREEWWCDMVDCELEEQLGVTFKPVRGNAVFWQNLRSDGTGHDGVLHAGLPVEEGVKTGMNIWTLTKKEVADV